MAAQRTARCKYCDALGVTKAHVLAASFTSLFHFDGDRAEYMVRHEYTDPETREQRLLKRAKTFAHKTRKMCSGCNAGWLRETVEAVRPTLDCFAHDTP